MDGYSGPQEWYAARWLRDYSLLAPWTAGSDVARSEKLTARLAFTPGSDQRLPWEAEAGLSAAAVGTEYSDAGRTQANHMDLSAAVSYRFLQGDSAPASLSLRYTRALELVTRELPGAIFATETSAYSSAVLGQGYLLTGIPFLEIFADTSASVLPLWPASLSSGAYSPAATLSFQRTYGSRPRDLFLPSLVELSVGREIERAADLSQSALYVRPRLVNRALNLFGKLGSVPAFPFFRTDEYSLGVSGSLEEVAGQPLEWALVSADASAMLSGFNGEELTLVESFRREQDTQITLSSETQLLYDWVSRPPAGVPLRFLPAAIAKTGYFSHRESAVLTVQWQDTGTYHPFNIVLGHASSLVFPDHGYLKASAGIGMDVESLGVGGLAYRLAVRIGLEANLTF